MKNLLLLTLLTFSGMYLHAETTVSDCDADFEFTVDGMTVTFTDLSTSDVGPILEWTWDFGDGTTSNESNPVHTYAEPGEYDVCLTIYADGGCEDDRCESNIPVGEIIGITCDAAFEFSGPELTVSFFDVSETDGVIISYLWDFGDGTTSDDANPVHTFPAAGVYEVCLTIVAEGLGVTCTATTCEIVIVGGVEPECTALFDFEIDGTTIYFESITDPGPGDVESYAWNFGDGTEGDGPNPIHTYEPGVYEVCLTVYFFGGCVAEFCDEIIISEGDCFVTVETFGGDSLSQHFMAWVTPTPDEVTYTWTFGDGSSFTETTAGTPSDPWHTYAEPGVYVVCVVIETAGGCVDEYCFEVEVGGGGVDCIAAFEWEMDGFTYYFINNSTGDGDVSYDWEFGDGSISDAENPVHTYMDPGVYEVCLTVTYEIDGMVCTDHICHTITIVEDGECLSEFSWEADGLHVLFHEEAAAGGADIVSYTWDFGDGTTSTETDPDHTYDGPGVYVACLTIVTADSCVNTHCEEITVEGGADCNAAFEWETDGFTYYFINNSTGEGDVTYEWSFGDGSVSTTEDPIHTYTEGGGYLVCLTVTYEFAGIICTDEVCHEIFVVVDGECHSEFNWEADGLHVFFHEEATGGGADIISYTWDFGDGTGSTETDPDHTYDEAGVYEVCLTIVTADSCTSTHCEVVTVEGDGDCIAGFEIESMEETGSGWIVNFHNTSSGSDNYFWTFGDGTEGEAENPDHLYEESGIYLVCLSIGVAGTDCYDDYCQELFVGGDDDCTDPELIDSTYACPEIYDPVCGCDGVTYDNSCFAEYYGGILFWTEGACAVDGIQEENIFGAVNIYPNPAQNSVTISYTVNTSNEITIELMDITGRSMGTPIIMNAVAGNYHYVLNTSEFAAGMYFINISGGGDIQTSKLLITR